MSMVKMVAVLLSMEASEEMTAAVIATSESPLIPVGMKFLINQG